MAEPTEGSGIVKNENLRVITGGPGCGKTTVIRELERRGFPVVEEIARKAIQEEVKRDGTALPWRDAAKYTKLMLSRSVESFLGLKTATAPTFCDRGIPDVLCYARLIRLHGVDEISEACEKFRYHRRVFILPPWREIYATDEERKESFAEAVQVYEMMIRTYRDCGYEISEVPRCGVGARADFVVEGAGL